MIYIKKIGTINNFEELKTEVINLQEKIKSSIISLQYRDINDINQNNATGYKFGPVEHEFTNINPNLIGTEIEKTLNSLPYKLFRTRIMTVAPNFRYDPHIDPKPRIHIPIVSNELCNFYFYNPKEIKQPYMPADGSIYWVDVRYKHTFENNSNISRIHIVGVTNVEF